MAEVHRSESCADRDAFGHWLSGFSDGESCFRLDMRLNRSCRPGVSMTRYPRARFYIGLRMDDKAILEEIAAFWGCGSISLKEGTAPSHSCNSKPQARFYVENLDHLAGVVVPHFDRYPLRAKKARDYSFWREATLLCVEVARRKYRSNMGVRGGARKWGATDRERFLALKHAMEETRRYIEPTTAPTISRLTVPPAERTLFDSQ